MSDSKHIAFLLPDDGRTPYGGYKIVFEYANRLAADGYRVTLVYPASFWFWRKSLRKKYRSLRRYLSGLRRKDYKAGWFRLDPRIEERWVWSLNECFVPRADIYIATACWTAGYLNRYRRVTPRKKYYLIQGYEVWYPCTEKQVLRSYRFTMRKIVIAEWLEEIVCRRSGGGDCRLIHNGLDFDYFRRTVDFGDRDRYCVCMLYHTAEAKGCGDAFRALEIVRKQFPELKVNIFGTTPRPEGLPEWYRYYQRPDRETHNRIYNEAAVFVAPSHSEGFGLTPCEAMMCGCAVACTDNGGYAVSCKAEETALVGPIRDPERLAENIVRLIEDDALRLRIARAGHENIRRFTWERAYGKLKNYLELE